MRDIGSILAAQLAAFIGLLLAASALHKCLRWRGTLRVVREFAGVPRVIAPAAALGAGIVECSAAVLLIAPSSRALGALLAASIWTGYLALIVRSLLAGRREVDCGCSFGARRHALGGFEVWRNVILAATALWVAGSSLREGPAMAASQVLGAAALLVLYFALDQLMGLQPMRKGAVL